MPGMPAQCWPEPPNDLPLSRSAERAKRRQVQALVGRFLVLSTGYGYAIHQWALDHNLFSLT